MRYPETSWEAHTPQMSTKIDITKLIWKFETPSHQNPFPHQRAIRSGRWKETTHPVPQLFSGLPESWFLSCQSVNTERTQHHVAIWEKWEKRQHLGYSSQFSPYPRLISGWGEEDSASSLPLGSKELAHTSNASDFPVDAQMTGFCFACFGALTGFSIL